MMDTPALSNALVELLLAAGLLFCLTTVGIGLLARSRSNSRRELSRYMLLGGISNFLSCISWSAPLLLEKATLRSLLILSPPVLVAGLVWGGIGALSVRQSVRAYRRWKKHCGHPIGDEEE
jgi:hypothetical protein